MVINMKKAVLIIPLLILPLILVSCVTSSSTGEAIKQDEVTSLLRDGFYQDASTVIHSAEEGYADGVIYGLDNGMVAFYSGDYREANAAFSIAERVIEENHTKRISKGAESLIVNDNVRDYEGELYEDVCTNIFNALSYYKLDDIEGAMVEVRRANIKLQDFGLNIKEQEEELSGLLKAFEGNPFADFPQINHTTSFHFSGLATYLSMLFYNIDGDPDNASVDMRLLADSGFSNIVSEEDVEIPNGKGRINFVSLCGLIAPKHEESTQSVNVLFPIPHKIAWPMIYKGEGSAVSSVSVRISGVDSIQLGVVENFTQDAVDSLHMTLKSTFMRSYYRGLTKMTAASAGAYAANKGIEKGANKIGGVLGAVVNGGGKSALYAALKAVNASEIADTRMCHYIPDCAYAGGLTLDPGTYQVDYIYHMKNGSTVTRSEEVAVFAGKNVVSISSCLK